MSKKIIMYKKRVCPRCMVVKPYLINKGYVIQEKDIDEMTGVKEELEGYNFKGLPILSAGDLSKAVAVTDVSDLDSWLPMRLETL